MSKLPPSLQSLPLPIIAAPLFIINTAETIIAQCKAGVVGTMPSLNARPLSQLEDWLAEITETLDAYNRQNPQRPAAPFGINLIVHKTNARLEQDLEIVSRFKVPLIITSLGARPEVNHAVHSYGGVVLHDVISNTFAHKAIEKGADGLIAVGAGAGGHAGVKSPFALMQEIRQWFDGPLALSGAIASGSAVLAAQAMGADFAYIGSAFIATHEARALDAYKQAIIESDSDGIIYTDLFTGVNGNYLRASIVRAGLDPDHLPPRTTNMNIGDERAEQKFQALQAGHKAAGSEPPAQGAKAWKDVWGCGQGIGHIQKIRSVQELVDELVNEYIQARDQLLRRPATSRLPAWVA